MTTPGRVSSVMVEFHRLGGMSGLLRKGDRYIRTEGNDAPACEITMELDHRDFMRHLRRLRYSGGTTAAQLDEALGILSAQAARMLPDLPEASCDKTVQLDLVAGAAELWAFPFEACCLNGVPTFANGERRMVLTRRVRGAFAEHTTPWPAAPRVLFVHASIATDLTRDLVDQHVRALERALGAWKRGTTDATLLTVRQAYALPDLLEARASAKFTHIHILAHGQAIPDPELPEQSRWGLRLGPPGADAIEPDTLADALKPREGLPVVVTVAACDSGNQSDPTIPTYSLAQELHRRGVPVVIGSQLPLTKAGSSLLAEHFYEPLLRGEDARTALHEVRKKLYEAEGAGRDWLGLVGYVRLPEGYADHLTEVGLRIELGLLDAAQERADALSRDGGTSDELKDIEVLVRARITTLEQRLQELQSNKGGLWQECQGLLASANKRLAELLFVLAKRDEQRASKWGDASLQALEAALVHYRAAFHSDIHKHWQGIQKLALEAALRGAINVMDWTVVLLGAQVRRDELKRDDEEKEYWALGTLAEVHLLAPFAGGPRDLALARDAIVLFKERAPAHDPFPIVSTRRQLTRYVRWWTKANGFFPGRDDLAQDANELVKLLD